MVGILGSVGLLVGIYLTVTIGSVGLFIIPFSIAFIVWFAKEGKFDLIKTLWYIYLAVMAVGCIIIILS